MEDFFIAGPTVPGTIQVEFYGLKMQRKSEDCHQKQGSDQLDSRFTLIRFWFEIESTESLEMSESWFTFPWYFILFDFDSQGKHDSRINRDSRRIKNQKE